MRKLISNFGKVMTIVGIIDVVNNGDKNLIVKRGNRVGQGVFEPYGITDGNSAKAKRTGGFGSSGR